MTAKYLTSRQVRAGLTYSESSVMSWISDDQNVRAAERLLSVLVFSDGWYILEDVLRLVGSLSSYLNNIPFTVAESEAEQLIIFTLMLKALPDLVSLLETHWLDSYHDRWLDCRELNGLEPILGVPIGKGQETVALQPPISSEMAVDNSPVLVPSLTYVLPDDCRSASFARGVVDYATVGESTVVKFEHERDAALISSRPGVVPYKKDFPQGFCSRKIGGKGHYYCIRRNIVFGKSCSCLRSYPVRPLLEFDACIYQDPVMTELSALSGATLYALTEDMYGEVGYPILSSLVLSNSPRSESSYIMTFDGLYKSLRLEAARIRSLGFSAKFPDFSSFSKVFTFYRIIHNGEHLSSVLVNKHGREIPFVNLYSSGVRSMLGVLMREHDWGKAVLFNYALYSDGTLVDWTLDKIRTGSYPLSKYRGLYFDLKRGTLVGDCSDLNVKSGNHVIKVIDDRFRMTCLTTKLEFVDFSLTGVLHCSQDCCKPTSCFSCSDPAYNRCYRYDSPPFLSERAKVFASFAQGIGFSDPHVVFLYKFISSGFRGDIRRAILMMMEIFASVPASCALIQSVWDDNDFDRVSWFFFLATSASNLIIDEKVSFVDFFRRHEGNCSIKGDVHEVRSSMCSVVNSHLNSEVLDRVSLLVPPKFRELSSPYASQERVLLAESLPPSAPKQDDGPDPFYKIWGKKRKKNF